MKQKVSAYESSVDCVFYEEIGKWQKKIEKQRQWRAEFLEKRFVETAK